MECRYCGKGINNRSRYCSNCGKLKRSPNRIRIVLIVLSGFTILLVSLFLIYKTQLDDRKQVDNAIIKEINLAHKENIYTNEPEEITPTSKPATEIKVDTQKEVSDIIAESLEKVLTIFTEDNQGTGFIINNRGDIITNAHVVEGAVDITVIDHESQSYIGKVIGYSNTHDVAVIRIPELGNHQSMEMNTLDYASIGEEVIALGSPLGKTNTATLGTIAAVNRSFYIGERIYENIYQMTAQISPGSSGGPLLSVKSGKVIGINSARSKEDESIGFSIPLKDVYTLINGWVTNPLTEQEVINQFYTNDGEYHYEEENEKIDEGYFEGGVTTKEHGVYYEIPENWYVEEEQNSNKPKEGTEEITEDNPSDNELKEKGMEDKKEENTESIPIEEHMEP